MNHKSEYLFVYGTLRRGFRLHRRLAKDSVRYVGKGKIRGQLYNLGAYPGVYPVSSNAAEVQGELYELLRPESQLRKLDAEEECIPGRPQDSLFTRRMTRVRLDDGQHLEAWAYFLPRKPVKARTIAHGDYSKVRRARR